MNIQAVVGALASGKGLKGLQTQFGSMDVPVMGHDAFDDVMVKVTNALENLSSEAFRAAREEKIRKVQKRWGREPIRVIDSEGKVHFWWPLSGSFDGAWPKRGTRQTGYNSQGGMATIIGTESGWVLDCEILISVCSICDQKRGRGEEAPPHECHKNYKGSAKAMEPEGAVRMAKRAQGYGVIYEELTTDADASTWAKLKLELPAEVYEHMVRQLDINHLKGNLYDKLAKLKASKFSGKG